MLAVLAFVGWLIARPPRDERDAAVRLAVGYAVMFTLDPSTRFGYYAYPLALVGWLALSRRGQSEQMRQNGAACSCPQAAARREAPSPDRRARSRTRQPAGKSPTVKSAHGRSGPSCDGATARLGQRGGYEPRCQLAR